ncbi:hypothetical protein [uncultured Thiothrix sp.]|uniref:hypothetical protein n=1 Tax=uncultured Thiothrix sp. TaxID=223185 RepID=UPI00260EDB51|nr:hypothetical protein [uncultured Thiothrix sp.]
MPHLVVDISAHGFGHLAQTTAVLNALEPSNLRLTIRSKAPLAILQERIHLPFELIPYQQDNGMVMLDALKVDVPKSFAWYQNFHANFVARVEQAAIDLVVLQADLLFANVPYLSLAAAHKLNLPTLALCSLNWADIFQSYCGHLTGAAAIHAEILQSYQGINCFLQPTPSMPMPSLANKHSIAPIASLGRRQSEHLKAVTHGQFQQFVLVGLGGIGMRYPLETWPKLSGIAWIFDDQSLHVQREDLLPVSSFGLSYIDLLASCDVVLTKTGYGMQTEAVVNQIPALCVQRGDWPEEPYLFAWHQEHGEVAFVDWQAIQTGKFVGQLQSLLATKWTKASVVPSGAAEAAQIIQQILTKC